METNRYVGCYHAASTRVGLHDNGVLLSGFAELQKQAIGFVISVLPSLCSSTWKNSNSTGRNLMKLDI